MNDQDILILMDKLKEDPEFSRDFNADLSWKLVSQRCGFLTDSDQSSYSFRDYLEYYVWQFTHAMVKPLAMSIAVFVLLLGGLVGASSASFSALPGDSAYPLKLSLEKTQLALAFDPQQKAKLQVEFTSRRLEEMVELSATAFESNPTAVRLAVAQFKKEVQSIRADLNVEVSNSTQTELAKAVGRKASTYKTTVADSSVNLPEDVQDEVDEVQTLLEETKDDAVQVIITAHEATDDEATAYELAKAFEKELASVSALELTTVAKEKVDLAVSLQKEGEYRRAFQLLKEVKLSFSAS